MRCSKLLVHFKGRCCSSNRILLYIMLFHGCKIRTSQHHNQNLCHDAEAAKKGDLESYILRLYRTLIVVYI